MKNNITIDKDLGVEAHFHMKDTPRLLSWSRLIYYKLTYKDIKIPIDLIRIYVGFSRREQLEILIMKHSLQDNYFDGFDDSQRNEACRKYLEDIIIPEEVIKAGKNLIALHKNPGLITYKTGITYNSYGLTVNNFNINKVVGKFFDIPIEYWKTGEEIKMSAGLTTPLTAGTHATTFHSIKYVEFKDYLINITHIRTAPAGSSFDHNLSHSVTPTITAAYSNCQLAIIENAEGVLSLKEPEKFLKLMDAFDSTLYYIHLAIPKPSELLDIFRRGGYKVVGEMQALNTKESTQNHYVLTRR